MKTLILLSGGLDSATLLADLFHQGHEIQAIQFGYGSLHQRAETNAAKLIADFYGVSFKHLELPSAMFNYGESALLGQSAMPEAQYNDMEADGPSSTVVPFRNAIMISCAVAMANSMKYDRVAVAVHASDHAHWAYPDCSPEFMGPMTAAVYAGTFHEVRLMTPFIWMTKTDIVALAAKRHMPAEWTWSCYKGGYRACGICPTCRERIEAFKGAGYIDPIDYEIEINWRGMEPWPLRLPFGG